MTMTPILVTGAAGFIGFHLAARYLDAGRPVVGLDNLNDYYDVTLKRARLDVLRQKAAFQFVHADLADASAMTALFARHKFEVVVNLAAQAGVRYSLVNPQAYVESNLVGFVNILEACRHHGTRHLLYASSSSVYGGVTKMPFSVHQNVDHPLSVYAATKKSNELLAHAYSHLFRLPTTGLRFFTVYGPWGRPDMALFIFTRAILAGKPIQIFNNGEMERDFTYIDDIVDGVFGLTERAPQPDANWNGDAPDPGRSAAPYRVYNIGNSKPVPLMQLIAILENCLGIEAKKEFLPMQPGDVPATYADIDDLSRESGFEPQTSIEAGVPKFVSWYRTYYKA
jgi:UDP-glucuronate 4-epimerase